MSLRNRGDLFLNRLKSERATEGFEARRCLGFVVGVPGPGQACLQVQSQSLAGVVGLGYESLDRPSVPLGQVLFKPMPSSQTIQIPFAFKDIVPGKERPYIRMFQWLALKVPVSHDMKQRPQRRTRHFNAAITKIAFRHTLVRRDNSFNSIHKRFNITEKHGLIFRAEMFNLPNRPNFTQPVTTRGAGNFGTINDIVGASSAREVQLGLRYEF